MNGGNLLDDLAAPDRLQGDPGLECRTEGKAINQLRRRRLRQRWDLSRKTNSLQCITEVVYLNKFCLKTFAEKRRERMKVSLTSPEGDIGSSYLSNSPGDAARALANCSNQFLDGMTFPALASSPGSSPARLRRLV